MPPDEYWKSEVSLWLRLCVLGGGFVCFFMGLMTMFTLGIYGIIDSLVVLGLGYGICFRRSRACAVIAGIYYAVNLLMLRLLPAGAGTASVAAMTYVFIALMIMSIYGTFTVHTKYTDYIASVRGTAPGLGDGTKKG